MMPVNNNLLASSQIHIPSELVKFLKQDTYSLLIKGYAGTGKTTFALSMLREMKIDKNCLYMSTRVSPDQLFQYHPWLGEIFSPPSKSSPTDAPEAPTDQPTIIDARLDEPSSLFERITNELMDVKAPTIILDTWEAISYFMDKDALMNNARVLQTWRERAGAKLIFISESPDDKTFDFLVDGVVELKLRHHNERRIREVFLSKLRGIRINRPSYLFSLNHGVFYSYERRNPSEFLRHAHLLIPNKKGKDATAAKEYISSGYNEFDDLLDGGLPHGCVVSIELEPNVNAKIVLAFLSKIFSNFVNNQDVLVLQSLENAGIELMERHLKSKEMPHELVSIFKFSHNSNKDAPENITSQIQETISSLKKKFPKKRILTMISSDMIEEIKLKRELSSFLYFIKTNSTISIFVSRRTADNLPHMSQHSDIHLRITDINGISLIQPEVPWSHLYAMVLRHGKESYIDLDPVV